jgi:hypothetical protein
MGSKPWPTKDLNIVKGAAKQRQAEDRLRADAWQKNREAELEAVVNRSYDGMDIPECRAAVEELSALAAPFIKRFDKAFAEHYPAEFAKATLSVSITPGGIDPRWREQVRRDAAKHLSARRAYMLANSASLTTEVVTDASKQTVASPEAREMLDRLAVPNETTPVLEPPGAAIGILRRLLPHPEEWGLAGYEAASPLLPDQTAAPKRIERRKS